MNDTDTGFDITAGGADIWGSRGKLHKKGHPNGTPFQNI
jgi:hypothetical protein